MTCYFSYPDMHDAGTHFVRGWTLGGIPELKENLIRGLSTFSDGFVEMFPVLLFLDMNISSSASSGLDPLEGENSADSDSPIRTLSAEEFLDGHSMEMQMCQRE